MNTEKNDYTDFTATNITKKAPSTHFLALLSPDSFVSESLHCNYRSTTVSITVCQHALVEKLPIHKFKKNVYTFGIFFINLWSGLCQNGSVEVAQVAPMGAHTAVRMPGGLTDPCHGVGVPKYRKSWGVHTARKTPYLGGNPGKRPKSRNFAPLDSRALKAP